MSTQTDRETAAEAPVPEVRAEAATGRVETPALAPSRDVRATVRRLAIESEQHVYFAVAGPYSDAPRSPALFAERLEELLSGEVSAWTTNQREASSVVGSRLGP